MQLRFCVKQAIVLSALCVGAGGCTQGLDALIGMPEPENAPIPDLMGAEVGDLEELNEGDDQLVCTGWFAVGWHDLKLAPLAAMLLVCFCVCAW